MARKLLCVVTALCLLAGTGPLGAQVPVSDPEVSKGIKQVDEGDYDAAIFTLDSAARRLAADPGKGRDLSQAYLYLGIAYFGKGHEAAAKAKFREAVAQIKDLTLSPEKFPPKVINLFEAAKEEQGKAGSAPASSADTKAAAAPPKKGGGGKGLLIGGLVVAAGAGVALAAKGGGSSTPNANTTRQTLNSSGSVGNQEQRFFEIVPSKAGTVDATVTWQDASVTLSIQVEEKDPPYTDVGTARQASATSSAITASVTAKPYNVIVSNFSGQATTESFTITILYP
jgi:hypothetical protein